MGPLGRIILVLEIGLSMNGMQLVLFYVDKFNLFRAKHYQVTPNQNALHSDFLYHFNQFIQGGRTGDRLDEGKFPYIRVAGPGTIAQIWP